MTDEIKEIKSGAIEKENTALIRYLQAGPIKSAMTLILALGGLIVLLFCKRHEFLPQAGWEALTTSLGAVALTGLLVTVSTIVAPLLPAFVSIDKTVPWEQRRKAFDVGFAIGAGIFFGIMLTSFLNKVDGCFNWFHLTEAWPLFALSCMALIIFSIATCRLRPHFRQSASQSSPPGAASSNACAKKSGGEMWCSYARIVESFKELPNELSFLFPSLFWIVSFLVTTQVASRGDGSGLKRSEAEGRCPEMRR